MVRSGFFDSIDGDRLYIADDLSGFFYGLYSDGVSVQETALQVEPYSGLYVKVNAGYGLISGKYVRNEGTLVREMEAPDLLFDRIDRVVLRLDTDARCIGIEIKQGTAAASPMAPGLTRSGGVYELSLAQVSVAAGATDITGADITDERDDDTVCGRIRCLCCNGGTGDYIPHGMIIPIMSGNAGEAGINGTYRTISESQEAHV